MIVYVVEERQEPAFYGLWDCMVLGVSTDLERAIKIIIDRAEGLGVRDSLVQQGSTFRGGGYEWFIRQETA